jgi:(p)ppGpp synthase/HD superfamily hydrolase
MNDVNNWVAKFQLCQYSGKLLSLIKELNKIMNVPVDIPTIKKACYYAKKYHGSQIRKSGEPYYSHPIEVAYLFAKYVSSNIAKYYTTNLITIAILHDCLEDTKLTKDMIAVIFNQSIANGVEDLTRLKHAMKTTAADTLNVLFIQYKFDILHIKIFDRLHNMSTIYAIEPTKQKKMIDETVSHFIPMAFYLESNEIKQEFIRLCRNAIEQKSCCLKHKLCPLLSSVSPD